MPSGNARARPCAGMLAEPAVAGTSGGGSAVSASWKARSLRGRKLPRAGRPLQRSWRSLWSGSAPLNHLKEASGGDPAPPGRAETVPPRRLLGRRKWAGIASWSSPPACGRLPRASAWKVSRKRETPSRGGKGCRGAPREGGRRSRAGVRGWPAPAGLASPRSCGGRGSLPLGRPARPGLWLPSS